MSSEDKIEAKVWLQENEDAEIGTLDAPKTKKLLTALYAAGADNVWIYKKYLYPMFPRTDTLHINVSVLRVANVMSRLANFHPDETHLFTSSTGYHLVEAGWN